MYCSNCGKKNPNHSQFCENCGGPLQAGSENITDASQGLLILENIKKHKVPLIMGITALIVVYLFISILNKPVMPINVAEKYMNALSGQDYAKAYKYIDSELNMPEKAYVYSMQEIEKKAGPIKEYRIENAEVEKKMEETLASSYERSYTVVLGRNTRDMTRLVVKNISASEKPDWRVEPFDSYNVQELELGTLPDMKLKVCGEEVKVSGDGRCIITFFHNIPLPIEISSPSIVTKTFQYPSQTEKYPLVYQASDKSKQEIQKAITDLFVALDNAKTQRNMQLLEPFIVYGSSAWNDIERWFYNEQDSTSLKVTRIEDNIKLALKNDEFSAMAKTYLDYQDSEGKISSNHANIELIQDNGTWKISDL